MSDPTHVGTTFIRRKRIFQTWKKCFSAIYLPPTEPSTRAAGHIEVYPTQKDWHRAKRGKNINLAGCVVVRTVSTGVRNHVVSIGLPHFYDVTLNCVFINQRQMLEDAINRAAFPFSSDPDKYQISDDQNTPEFDPPDAPWNVESFRVQLYPNASSKRLGLKAPAPYDLELAQNTVQLREVGRTGEVFDHLVVEAWPYEDISWFSYGFKCAALGTDASGTSIELLTPRPERLYERLRLRVQLWPDAKHEGRPDGCQLKGSYYGGYRVVRKRHFGEEVDSPAQYAPRCLIPNVTPTTGASGAASSCGRASSLGSVLYDSDVADNELAADAQSVSASNAGSRSKGHRRRRAKSAFARLLRRRSRVDDHFEWPQFEAAQQGQVNTFRSNEGDFYPDFEQQPPQNDVEFHGYGDDEAIELNNEMNGLGEYFDERPPSPPEIYVSCDEATQGLSPCSCISCNLSTPTNHDQSVAQDISMRGCLPNAKKICDQNRLTTTTSTTDNGRPFSMWSDGPSVRLSQMAPRANMNEIEAYTMQQDSTILASQLVRSITMSSRSDRVRGSASISREPMEPIENRREVDLDNTGLTGKSDMGTQTDNGASSSAKISLNTFEIQAQKATIFSQLSETEKHIIEAVLHLLDGTIHMWNRWLSNVDTQAVFIAFTQ